VRRHPLASLQPGFGVTNSVASQGPALVIPGCEHEDLTVHYIGLLLDQKGVEPEADGTRTRHSLSFNPVTVRKVNLLIHSESRERHNGGEQLVGK
jgi:hypothetical protein